MSEILPEGFPEMLHVIFLPASLPACLGPFHEVHSQYHPRPFQVFGFDFKIGSGRKPHKAVFIAEGGNQILLVVLVQYPVFAPSHRRAAPVLESKSPVLLDFLYADAPFFDITFLQVLLNPDIQDQQRNGYRINHQETNRDDPKEGTHSGQKQINSKRNGKQNRNAEQPSCIIGEICFDNRFVMCIHTCPPFVKRWSI